MKDSEIMPHDYTICDCRETPETTFFLITSIRMIAEKSDGEPISHFVEEISSYYVDCSDGPVVAMSYNGHPVGVNQDWINNFIPRAKAFRMEKLFEKEY